MARRVAICAVAQTTYQRSKWDQRFQGMALDVVESLQQQTGLDFSQHRESGMSISVSDDVFDARTISDNPMTDVLGAHFGCEEKVAQEGAQALYYGLAAIQSGHVDVVLVLGHCKESQAASRNMVTHMAFDPFYTRPVGLDFCAAAGLQAQAYAARSGIGDEHLAKVVVRARENAVKNPLTPEVVKVSREEVLSSPMLADPIRELHAYPVSDGAVGMILAAEERAKNITKRPVWINGVGNCMDSFFFGDRDLASNFALKKAAAIAYKRAGITEPRTAFDVIELSDQYAYQQPMWAEGLGICDEGGGPAWIHAGGPERSNVNLSGGMLAGNPLILGGLVRAAEAALQLMGKAGERQVRKARTALAHGVMGPAGQFHTVAVLERG
jgi:acetyl-CoA C-acetyltransferase